MKLLHTSDILLGQDFSHCYPCADRARAARVEVLRSLLALARREQVDAVIVAGNLWADNRVGKALVDEAAGLLSKSLAPVYLLPGHRDPMTADSPYELYSDRFTGKIKVLSANEPLLIKGGLTLLPCPVKNRASQGDPTRWIPERDREALRVAVVNTSEQGYQVAAGGVTRRDLDYVAAGGEANASEVDGVHWSGAPEATDFGQDAGTVTIVNLEPDEPVQSQRVRVGALDWTEETLELGAGETLKELTRRWSKHENRASTLLRITLRGSLPIENLAEVESARRTLTSKLLHLDYRNEVAPLLDGTSLSHHPLLGTVASLLAARAAQPFAHSSSDVPEEPEVAREALAMLLRLLEKSPHADLR